MPNAYKKVALTMVTCGLMGASVLAQAAGGTIHFVGQIVEGTCQVPTMNQMLVPAHAQLDHCASHVAQGAQMTIQPIVQKTLIPITANVPAQAGKPQPKLAILLVEYR